MEYTFSLPYLQLLVVALH